VGAICAENWAVFSNAANVGGMFIVALAVGIGLFAFDVYELANRRTH
jgi:hypothetical protein